MSQDGAVGSSLPVLEEVIGSSPILATNFRDVTQLV